MSDLATTKGKEHALEQLNLRRTANAEKKIPDNASLPAGSPMYYGCKSCNEVITVPENWISRPVLCPQCQALKDCGWLE